MLTYPLTKTGGISLYEQLYRCIKADILTGRLAAGEKLPSKRALAAHLEVSVITVKNAYEQLMAEGYIYGMEKKGYYVSPVQRPLTAQLPRQDAAPPAEHHWEMDLVTNSIAAEDFPFTVWARLMRQTILEQGTGLLHAMPPQGAPELRRAIAAYLRQFRGMTVDAEQIIIGAGTEVLYSMLVQLLGRDKRYAVEEPGYGKITRIYRSNQAEVVSVPLDAAGLSVSALDAAGGRRGAHLAQPPLPHGHRHAHRPAAGAAALGGARPRPLHSGGRLRQRVPVCGTPHPHAVLCG